MESAGPHLEAKDGCPPVLFLLQEEPDPLPLGYLEPAGGAVARALDVNKWTEVAFEGAADAEGEDAGLLPHER
jgi:hypothetical protein